VTLGHSLDFYGPRDALQRRVLSGIAPIYMGLNHGALTVGLKLPPHDLPDLETVHSILKIPPMMTSKLALSGARRRELVSVLV